MCLDMRGGTKFARVGMRHSQPVQIRIEVPTSSSIAIRDLDWITPSILATSP